jgi:Fe-Mn family superoxide dismutase
MSIDFRRRDFIGTAGLTAAGIAAAATLGTASAQTPPAQAPSTQTPSTQTPSGRSAMTYDVKKLPFEPSRIKGLSEKLLVSHYENNYTGAVKRLNAIAAQTG